MGERYEPGQHPRQKEFRNTNPTREGVQEMLQVYDDLRIKKLEARILWLELPAWERAWRTLRSWWEGITSDEEES